MPPVHYMSREEVAAYIGVRLDSLNRYDLPEHDGEIGIRRLVNGKVKGQKKGWLKQTIDQWNAERPGRGRWGPH